MRQRPAWPVSRGRSDHSTETHATEFSSASTRRESLRAADGSWLLTGDAVAVQELSDFRAKNTNEPLGPGRAVSAINSWSHCAVAHTFAVQLHGAVQPWLLPLAVLHPLWRRVP